MKTEELNKLWIVFRAAGVTEFDVMPLGDYILNSLDGAVKDSLGMRPFPAPAWTLGVFRSAEEAEAERLRLSALPRGR